MNETNEQEYKGVQVIEVDDIHIIIPQCCREGWDDCVHAIKEVREKPKNIAV